MTTKQNSRQTNFDITDLVTGETKEPGLFEICVPSTKTQNVTHLLENKTVHTSKDKNEANLTINLLHFANRINNASPNMTVELNGTLNRCGHTQSLVLYEVVVDYANANLDEMRTLLSELEIMKNMTEIVATQKFIVMRNL